VSRWRETPGGVAAALNRYDRLYKGHEMSDETTPITQRRRWKVVAYFQVDDTPDPAYDVSACERLADALYLDVEDSLKTIPLAREVYVEDVMVEDDRT
jgi:hypothetical protein